MPEGMEIEVETVELDEGGAIVPMRKKRFLFNGLFKVGNASH